ncbi:MAG: TatD family hydrolase [Treponema sp.]|nr:TatD family hydrolase [Treponema sp.]
MKRAGRVTVVRCFAVHPRLPAVKPDAVKPSLETPRGLAAENGPDATGETGRGLFNAAARDAGRADYRMSENAHGELFAERLDSAVAKGLPLVLHIREAAHKVFAHAKRLKNVSAVVFHSYSGAVEGARGLLRRGVNAYVSFGTPVLPNHTTERAACARLPMGGPLSETGAPYRPLWGESFSHWGNLRGTARGIAALRKERMNAGRLAVVIGENFRTAYGRGAFPSLPSIRCR